MFDVLINQGIDVRAVLWWGIFHAQQRSNFIQGHVQPTAVPDEQQPFNMLGPIDPVVAISPLRLGQQCLTFVVTNGLHLCFGGLSELSNPHEGPP